MESPLGYKSINETVDLRPGFYWIWSEDEVRKSYITFSAKLQEENQGYDAELKSFNEILPPAYPCPFIGSCKGGFDANCSHGYEGILCAVCSRGFYKMFSGCNECPSVYLFVGQCLAVFIVVAIITFVIVKDKKARSERSAADNIFSSLKIVIGFYQVTSGTLRAYSYIQWPTALTKLMKFADVVQLNIFKLVPMECLSHSIKITPYVGLVTYVSLNVLVILLAMGYLYARKVFLKMKNVNQEERNKNLFACKANCYRAVFLFLFVTYPATCEKVFQVLPFGCTKVCDNQQTCNWYLRSDYSVQCYTSVYNKYALLAFFALLIPVLFPVVTVIMLWKYCRNHVQYKNATASVKGFSERKLTKKALLKQEKKRKEENEVSVGMRFIYENYSTDCWYWEVIELVRKLILTAVVVHSGREGRSFLGISAIFSGFYAIFFAQSKPVPYIFDHWLHLGSLLGTLANQMMGMLLKIPVENESSLVNEEDDSVGVHVLLICANVMVLVMLAVRYIYSVAFALMIVKENPQCSGSCIMTVMQVVALENGKEEVIRRHRAGSFEKKRGVQGFNP
ncbi:uncharacterized protein LOC116303078 [Actinia tenebrosa]|uniref:Uncharacterized protein LOC116303078 n=1 Tax=Actinia tenebrosa TaxID=6105 RepID=A0A6P8IPL3_ACTTE|nr:uncharacterized protein LOC116303078 [Actinia tenebrosa]